MLGSAIGKRIDMKRLGEGDAGKALPTGEDGHAAGPR